MRTVFRFASGFFLGCILLMWSLLLSGAGEGSMTPLVAGFPELVFPFAAIEKWGLPGFWLVMLPSAGLLWAIYFGALPAINSFIVRMLIVIVVFLVHFGAGAWALSKDIGFDPEFQRYPVLTVGYFVFFLIVLLLLGALTWIGSKRRPSTVSS
jgi:hypothetical protein